MSLSIGIVGLPNVGKSTLFTALTKKTGLAANYPFATIDPNVGIVDVPDSRLQKLADIVNPGRIVPATVEFVDIAGLVKGANEGEGLGNQFLANIRETDAICEVVRYFKDPNVMREVGRTGEFVDPAGDADTIMTELILADMGTLEKQLPKLEKEAKRDKELMPKFEVAKRLLAWLNEGKRAASMEMTDEERAAAKGLFLLTMKPILYVANVDEDMLNEDLASSHCRSAPRSRPSFPSSIPRMRPTTWRAWAWSSPAWTCSRRQPTSCSVCSRSLRLARWRSRPGRCVRARPPRRPPVSSIPTLSAALLRPRSLAMTTTSSSVASKAPRLQASCASRAKSMSWPMATSCTSALTCKDGEHV